MGEIESKEGERKEESLGQDERRIWLALNSANQDGVGGKRRGGALYVCMGMGMGMGKKKIG